jgi:hypothetical protein
MLFDLSPLPFSLVLSQTWRGPTVARAIDGAAELSTRQKEMSAGLGQRRKRSLFFSPFVASFPVWPGEIFLPGQKGLESVFYSRRRWTSRVATTTSSGKIPPRLALLFLQKRRERSDGNPQQRGICLPEQQEGYGGVR